MISPHVKWLFGIVALSVLVLLGNRFLIADMLLQSEEKTFKKNLTDKNISFLQSRISNSDAEKSFIKTFQEYDKIIDPKVHIWFHTTFFSFLGLKKDSSRLYSHFGIISENNFLFDSPLQAKILKKDKNSITIQNTSLVAYPLNGKILIIPSDVSGTALFDGVFLPVGQKATLRFVKEIPEKVLFLESVDYGFRLTLEE